MTTTASSMQPAAATVGAYSNALTASNGHVGALIRAGSSDRRTWGPYKALWMRAIAVTTQWGIARVNRPQLPQPQLFPALERRPSPALPWVYIIG